MQVESDLDEFQWISMFRPLISDTGTFKMFFYIMIYDGTSICENIQHENLASRELEGWRLHRFYSELAVSL